MPSAACAGCASKLAAGELARVLSDLPPQTDPGVLVDFRGSDDAGGYVRVTGRLKDIVIRGGLNISVRQVEDLLTAHPAVGAAAAVGMPDPVLGERVCCYLVPAPGAARRLHG